MRNLRRPLRESPLLDAHSTHASVVFLMAQTPGERRNNSRVKVTLPDDIRLNAMKIAEAQGISLSELISRSLTTVVVNDPLYLDKERSRLANAFIAVDAKVKIKKYKSKGEIELHGKDK